MTDDKRGSEVAGFERWMTLAFGRERDDAFTDPIDVRLHRRLGELYLGRRDWKRASNQLRLARLAAPRDIYVLRPLGQAYMTHYLDSDSLASAAERDELTSRIQEVLAAIEELDPEAYVKTPDAAALRIKFERKATRNTERAIEICERALRNNPDSYYLADILGQTWLELDNLGKAREAYEQAVEILDRLQENNVWTFATSATANLVLGRPDRARESLAKLKRLSARPSSAELDTVARGIRDVAGRLNLTEPDIEGLLQLLQA